MTDDVYGLRALAQAATPGPWEQSDYHAQDETCDVEEPDTGKQIACSADLADAAFIAAADPTTILDLIERAEKAEAETVSLQEANDELAAWHSDATRERDEARAQVAAVHALAARMDDNGVPLSEGWARDLRATLGDPAAAHQHDHASFPPSTYQYTGGIPMSDFDELVGVIARAPDSNPDIYGGIHAARANAVLGWLLRHDRAVAAQTLRDAADDFDGDGQYVTHEGELFCRWLRDRADTLGEADHA